MISGLQTDNNIVVFSPGIRAIGYEGRDKVLLLLLSAVLVSRFFVVNYPAIDVIFQLGSILGAIASSVCVLAWRIRVNARISTYFGLVAMMLLSEGIYTMTFRGESLYYFLSASYSYIYLLTIVPFVYLFRKYGPERVMRSLQILGFVLSLFMLFAAALFNFGGISIVESMRLREGTARFSETGLVDVIAVYAAYKVFGERGTTFDLLTLLLTLGSIILVSQTRVMVLSILLAIGCVLVFRLRGANRKLLGCIGMMTIILIAALNGNINSFVASFSTSGVEAASTNARIEEVSYYLCLFRQNPVLGIGLVAYESPLRFLISGPYGTYYLDDVGVVGALGTIGLWIVPLYFLPIMHFFADAARVSSERRALLVGLIVLLLGTTMTLLYVYPFCDPVWPLIFAIFVASSVNDRKAKCQ
jgi:hypothetical protein